MCVAIIVSSKQCLTRTLVVSVKMKSILRVCGASLQGKTGHKARHAWSPPGCVPMKLGVRQNPQEVSSLAGAWECEWVSCLGPSQEQADCLPLSLATPSNSFSTSEEFPSHGVPIPQSVRYSDQVANHMALICICRESLFLPTEVRAYFPAIESGHESCLGAQR